MSDEMVRKALVEKHTRALLLEMKVLGIDVLGFAGGLVLKKRTANGGNAVHAFFLVAEDVVREGDEHPLNGEEFMVDVGRALASGKLDEWQD